MNQRDATAICRNVIRLTKAAAKESNSAAKKELRVTARVWANKLKRAGYACACSRTARGNRTCTGRKRKAR